MRRNFLAIACGIVALSVAAPSWAQSETNYLEKLYLHLHQNPELSLQEFETSKRMAAELTQAGYDVTTDIGGTGLVAVMKNGDGPTLMLRADMDALPLEEKTGLSYASKAKGVNQRGQDVSVMHACGHDIHMTSLIGTARNLAKLKDQWSGTLILIGQPAEEVGKGAKAMLNNGLYKRFGTPDFNIALHVSATLPAGTVGYSSGFALANVDSVDIKVRGIGGHGAYPHTTKDPIVLAAYIVTALQTLVSREISPLDPAVVTVGSIHGGSKHNIISDGVHLQLTVRSYSDETRAKLLDGIKRIAENQGRVFGLPEDLLPIFELKDEYTPATYNNPELSTRVAAAISKKLGAENVKIIDPVMGGEDFGRFGRTDAKVPGVIYWLGTVEPKKHAKMIAEGTGFPSLHSPFFAPDRIKTIETGVASMSAIALDLLAKE
ncbi:MAG: amidohydrolase [Robiginitomaculum sp.]|nr:amidohydrolase [Robiginitomaculum sp.]